jgi:hypothetical protein
MSAFLQEDFLQVVRRRSGDHAAAAHGWNDEVYIGEVYLCWRKEDPIASLFLEGHITFDFVGRLDISRAFL